jgi:nucleoside-triphosphatase THEP1
MNIVLFSRPVRSGKSTELAGWCGRQQDVSGVLMPDIAGLRHFQDVSNGRCWPAIAAPGEAAIEVGPYRFSQRALNEAAALIRPPAPGCWLVIDEIGKLEVRGEGFAAALTSLLDDCRNEPFNLLLVVRDTLLEEVMESFGLQDARILHSLDDL